MAAYYVDSSALTERYVAEIGSSWIIRLADPQAGHDLYTATVSAPEVIAAVSRRARGGHLDPALAARGITTFRRDWDRQYQAIAPGPRVISRAMDIAEFQGLRGYDAIHVATALDLWGDRRARALPDLIFISADRDQLRVAEEEGLAVEDPNQHP